MNKRSPTATRTLVLTLVILVLINLAIFGWASFPLIREHLPFSLPGVVAQSFSPTPSETPLAPEETAQPEEISVQAPAVVTGQPGGVVILALRDGIYSHLFAYHPLDLPLTRITNSAWDDISPALSPDGTRLAFSSRRNGYWDLYVMELQDGSITRLTDSPEYDAWPSWSPDGQWLVYESYTGKNLDLYVRSAADPTQPPMRLTDDPGADRSPCWSPVGREVAFVSTRSGDPEIWLALLDQTEGRFTNISASAGSSEDHPAWSPDGSRLAWTSENDGVSTLEVWDSQNPGSPPLPVGSGDWPAWSPDGQILLARVHLPNGAALEGYSMADRSLLYPLSPLPGSLEGMQWKNINLPLPGIPNTAPQSLFEVSLSADPLPPAGRFGIVPLDDVTAPYPYLHDGVDESFNALRRQSGIETGWDVLSSLENAYFPLTEPPSPGMELNWLLTGRGVAINPMPMYAGWMAVVKEDFDGQVYWRVYLKARYQDGSQGRPLGQMPWDINSRYTGDPSAYEKGGRLGAIPEGYWVDFTEIASRYGWQRLPALNSWRTYLPAARFNQFILTGGLDWNAAMVEVYPPEALMTATYVPTRTPTITLTPAFKSLYTQTPTLPPTPTATSRPTWTPAPP